MKLLTLSRLGTMLVLLIALIACKEDNSPFSFYSDTYEVGMGKIRYLGLESGNGNYTLQVENPYIIRAQTESGWSCPGGTQIYVHGLLTGETQLTVTDNETGEQRTLTIKVTDNYEVLRLFSAYPKENSAPIPMNAEFLYLIDNYEREAYFFVNKAATRVTSSDLSLQGKGNYAFSETDGKHYLTLTYPENKTTVSRSFLISNAGGYVHHRLNKNLNLNWNTPAGSFDSEDTTFDLKETTSGKEIGIRLIEFEMPEGILP